jgi:uncharacterized protein
VVAGVGAVGLAAALYGALIEPRWFRLREETLPALRRGEGGSLLRVLLLADTHLSPPAPGLERFVRSLADEPYDLVVAGGDMLGASGAEQAGVELLAPLTADGRPGIAALGSNDLWAPRLKSPHLYFTDPGRRVHGPRLATDRYRAGLEETGWTVLEDDRRTIATHVGPVEVAGLRDPHIPDATLPERSRVLARDPSAVARIGIVHAPYVPALDLLAETGYDLILCGHTHGGQVRLPPLGALVTNSDLATHRARGTSRWAGSWLHVSAGLGQSRYAPVRFACRPEASLLTLTR